MPISTSGRGSRLSRRLWPKPHRLHALRFHDLRHCAAAYTIDASGATEVSLVLVMKRLGHRNIATTVDVYGHLLAHADKTVPTRSATCQSRVTRLTPTG